jgi:maleamate amidohydrolase
MPSAPRIGYGNRAAVLVVDFARGWTDPDSELSMPLNAELEATATLLAAARDVGAPIVYTTVAYEEAELEAIPMLQKTARVKAMRIGSWLTEIDPRIAPELGDLVLTKKHASAFFGTPLAAHLAEHDVDTVLIAGCITSGCVRATAVDSAQHGLRTLVVEETVADRSLDAHTASLSSIDSLYGDVISLAEAVTRLHESPGAPTPEIPDDPGVA